jgi:hypothetical protein
MYRIQRETLNHGQIREEKDSQEENSIQTSTVETSRRAASSSPE